MEVDGGKAWSIVSAGDYHNCGVTQEGELYCWGYNNHGQIGAGNEPMYTTPQLVNFSK